MSAGGQASERVGQRRPLRRDAVANEERVLAAAVSAMLRDGRQVPMATIAAEAGVGVATLYRRFADREALLDALTHRSFELLMELARSAETRSDAALACLNWWWDQVIEQRDQLVLPLAGGPAVQSAETLAVQSQLHQSLGRLLDRGQRDGSVRADVTTRDLILFGAMLVTPLPGTTDWGRAARRHKKVYLDGLSCTDRPTLR